MQKARRAGWITRPLKQTAVEPGNRGFLAADWKKTETGREAKFYRMTRKGRKQLEDEAASWQRLIEAVGLILGMADRGAQ